MNHFDHINGVLHAEQVPLPVIADAVGTPVYVYSRATLERHAQVFRDALSDLDNPHLAFAVKANPNLAVLKVLARQGYGADVVSGGEMDRALAAGMAAEDIVFSGVGKTADEIVYKDILESVKVIYINTSEVGHFNDQMINDKIPDFLNRVWYISGPHNMVSATEKILKSLSIKKIKTDFFPGLV